MWSGCWFTACQEYILSGDHKQQPLAAYDLLIVYLDALAISSIGTLLFSTIGFYLHGSK